MAAPTKDGKKWRHRVMVAGTRFSGTFDTKAAALAWEAEQRTKAGGKKAVVNTGDGGAGERTVENDQWI